MSELKKPTPSKADENKRKVMQALQRVLTSPAHQHLRQMALRC